MAKVKANSFQAVVFSVCAAGALGGGPAMKEVATSETYLFSTVGATPNAVGLVRNGEIFVVDQQTMEDADDLRALDEALAEGDARPFEELLTELGLS